MGYSVCPCTVVKALLETEAFHNLVVDVMERLNCEQGCCAVADDDSYACQKPIE